MVSQCPHAPHPPAMNTAEGLANIDPLVSILSSDADWRYNTLHQQRGGGGVGWGEWDGVGDEQEDPCR